MYKNMESKIKNTQKDPSSSGRRVTPKGVSKCLRACPNAWLTRRATQLAWAIQGELGQAFGIFFLLGTSFAPKVL
jgi:hypothetical protein